MSKKPRSRTSLEHFHGSTFIIFFRHYDGTSLEKCPSYWYLKSQDCLLTHWLPITSILFVIRTIYRNQFKCNYLRKWFYLLFFASYLKFISNFEHFEDKAHSLVVKDSRYRRSFDSQNVKEIETLLNISRPTFIILLYNSGKNSVKKYLS